MKSANAPVHWVMRMVFGINIILFSYASLTSAAGVEQTISGLQASFQDSAVPMISFATSFEDGSAGELTSYQTGFGQWTAARGHAALGTYAKTGKQCLHILGGEKRTVEFTPDLKGQTVYRMSFWAERWTRQNPFSFRIDAQIGSDWKEIYNGDKEIKVGQHFLSNVSIPLPEQTIQKFRFICTSPGNSGVILDDFHLYQASPMALLGVTTAQQVAPVLIRKDTNAVLQIKVNVVGNLSPLEITLMTITPDGTTALNDIDLVQVFYTGTDDAFSDKQPFSTSQKPASKLIFRGRQVMEEGTNNFWVSYKLKDSADLLHKVDAGCLSVEIESSNGTHIEKPDIVSPPIVKRIGHNIRNAGDDGSKGYRIPGLATTNNGTLIAVYDIRYGGMGDLPGNIDVGMSRSTDKGQSWEPMQVIMDMGPPHNKNGIGDPSVLVDRLTNTIWIAAVWAQDNNGWNGSGPGMTPQETTQFVLVKSSDDGKTWSKPINITPQIKDSAWHLLCQSPGKGITLRDGTLVFPAQFRDENRVPHSTLIYSKDRGTTWTIGTGAKSNTTECQIVELNDDSLMLNMRDDRGGSRSVYTTKDLGKTWQVHPTSRIALPEPVCMASLIRFASVKDGDARDVLLFSNPASTQGRLNMTIKASLDEGMTWPQEYQKLYHEPGCAGYSCLTKIDENTFGILYEGGNTALLVFEKFRIDEIITD